VLLEKELERRNSLAFARFHTKLDALCEYGAADLRALRRWFFRILPDVTTRLRNPSPSLDMLLKVHQEAEEKLRKFQQLWQPKP
jgi:hypothetical protein